MTSNDLGWQVVVPDGETESTPSNVSNSQPHHFSPSLPSQPENYERTGNDTRLVGLSESMPSRQVGPSESTPSRPAVSAAEDNLSPERYAGSMDESLAAYRRQRRPTREGLLDDSVVMFDSPQGLAEADLKTLQLFPSAITMGIEDDVQDEQSVGVFTDRPPPKKAVVCAVINYAYKHQWPNKKLLKVLSKITPEVLVLPPLASSWLARVKR